MTADQKSAYESPWSAGERWKMLLWEWCWLVFCCWTPKPLNPWRLLWLRLFGAKIEGTPFVHQRARIAMPWNLTLLHRACLGDRANAYSLGPIALGEGATVAQEAYLCAGTHDFTKESLPLVTKLIRIGDRAFVGARAFVMPGVSVGERSIVGAGAIVTHDVEAGTVVAGNPARPIRRTSPDGR